MNFAKAPSCLCYALDIATQKEKVDRERNRCNCIFAGSRQTEGKPRQRTRADRIIYVRLLSKANIKPAMGEMLRQQQATA